MHTHTNRQADDSYQQLSTMRAFTRATTVVVLDNCKYYYSCTVVDGKMCTCLFAEDVVVVVVVCRNEPGMMGPLLMVAFTIFLVEKEHACGARILH